MKTKELRLLIREELAKELKENKRPDYPDVDKDGDRKEPMEKALKDKESSLGEVKGARIGDHVEVNEMYDEYDTSSISRSNLKSFLNYLNDKDISYSMERDMIEFDVTELDRKGQQMVAKLFESVNEGSMSDLDALAKESENFEDFIKKILSDREYNGIFDVEMGENKKTLKYLKDVFNTSKEESLEESIDREFHSTSKTTEHPNPNELSAEEIQAYINDNPHTLWGRSLNIWKMVLQDKMHDEDVDPVRKAQLDYDRGLEEAEGSILNLSDEDMEKLHKGGKLEIGGHKILYATGKPKVNEDIESVDDSIESEIRRKVGENLATWLSPDNPPFSKEFLYNPKYFEPLIKDIMGIINTRNLNEESNIGLADLEERGYEAGGKAAYTYGTLLGKLKNRPDKLAYNKGFIQGVKDELGSSLAENMVAEDLDLGHEDNEPHMLKADLYRIGKYAMDLYKMMDGFEGEGEVDLPHWWQSKISNAKSAIVGAKHYLDFELNEPQIDAMVNVASEEEVIDEELFTPNEMGAEATERESEGPGY